MMNCRHYEWEQRDEGLVMVTLACRVCGCLQHLVSFPDEDEDKWRDERDRVGKYALQPH